jgi:RNA polymerase sigma factor (TIGR02999 family)
MGEVTRILGALGNGDTRAAEELLPLVYRELRSLAAEKMAREPPGQTLQPTALVHEAWVRMTGGQCPQFANRAHFFAAASQAMRHILIDIARRKKAARHGGGRERVHIESLDVAASTKDDELLAVDGALDELAAFDPQKAELVKLRYFVGLTLEETAEILGIPLPAAKRSWTFARAWLYEAILRQRNP